ncbi:mechanosensitive ion channel family protein [Gloeocapsopsis dulcis]|uniref:Mechanosensitive ion channel protein MscS n=1 Tax=Gloeocapsopsis dulcis AAB1 = 1H9 TaxID=1433147 RepID=A0A6N8FXJ2_9CHRO|nr:mechanosensitive ion channel family protein [Gloeocapsopsis dulcis]MUL37793.1 mechanosensitive ion channel protein MscS [Gloeocapsopsis dulcis AAB1 = 1H9]WNN90587.1 mechanosensitive ion channel family protein [Gloeocapsopsis dulcis]
MNVLIQEVQTSLLQLLGNAIEALPAFAAAIIVLFLTRYAANVTRRMTYVATKRVVKSQSLRSLLVQISHVATWVAGILFACVLAFPDLRLGDIIGLLGLSSVAFGFAFQDIFKNFLAGVLLLLNEPFRLGDQIIVNGSEGTVEDITIRSTQIRTYQGERVLIPNAIVFTSSVQVLTAMPHRRTDLELGVDYNTNLASAIDLLLETVKQVKGVLPSPSPEVDAVAFGDSAIELVVRYWSAPQKIQVRQTRTRVIVALKRACDRAEINIPYPIRTLYYYNQEKFNDHYSAEDNTDSHVN